MSESTAPGTAQNRHTPEDKIERGGPLPAALVEELGTGFCRRYGYTIARAMMEALTAITIREEHLESPHEEAVFEAEGIYNFLVCTDAEGRIYASPFMAETLAVGVRVARHGKVVDEALLTDEERRMIYERRESMRHTFPMHIQHIRVLCFGRPMEEGDEVLIDAEGKPRDIRSSDETRSTGGPRGVTFS